MNSCSVGVHEDALGRNKLPNECTGNGGLNWRESIRQIEQLNYNAPGIHNDITIYVHQSREEKGHRESMLESRRNNLMAAGRR